MEDLIYKIGITRIPQVGAVTARQLISYCGGPRAVFEAAKGDLMRIPGIGATIAANIRGRQVMLEAETEMKFMERHGVRPLFYLDEGYPRRLRHIPDSPVLLYYRGTAELNAPRVVSIVGTRQPSVYGLSFCEELVKDLKAYDVLVVSGLAYGIDIATHRSCLRAGLPTVGVLGHGFSLIYPPQHRAVAEKMIAAGGLLTEYPSHMQPDREHFPMRNRIIAGMCDALVVVETAGRGGSIISAELANSYHKDVFAVPGRVRDRQSEGCNLLIKTHKAALLESAADLAAGMRWDEPPRSAGIQGELFPDLSPEEKIVVDLLGRTEAVGIDQLTAEAGKTHSEMASLLLGLEFKGLIRSLPGKRFALL